MKAYKKICYFGVQFHCSICTDVVSLHTINMDMKEYAQLIYFRKYKKF